MITYTIIMTRTKARVTNKEKSTKCVCVCIILFGAYSVKALVRQVQNFFGLG